MSCVKEHYIVRDIGEDDYSTVKYDLVQKIGRNLAETGASMLDDLVYVDEIRLLADGKEYSYSGDCPGESYKEIIRSIKDANDIELSVTMSGIGHISLLSAYDELEFFEKLHEEELKDIFCSIWTRFDEDNAEPNLYAFGEYNGRMYNGEVEFVDTDVFPEGEWFAEEEMAIYGILGSSEVKEEVLKICREIETMSEDKDNIRFCDEEIDYYVNMLTIRTAEDFSKLCTCYRALKDLGCGVDFFGHYWDISGEHGRTMRVDYETGKISVAEIR